MKMLASFVCQSYSCSFRSADLFLVWPQKKCRYKNKKAATQLLKIISRRNVSVRVQGNSLSREGGDEENSSTTDSSPWEEKPKPIPTPRKSKANAIVASHTVVRDILLGFYTDMIVNRIKFAVIPTTTFRRIDSVRVVFSMEPSACAKILKSVGLCLRAFSY